MHRSFRSLWERWNGIVVAVIMGVLLEVWPPVSIQWHMAFRSVMGIVIYITVVGLDYYDAVKTFDLDDPHISPRARDTLHAYEQYFVHLHQPPRDD